MLKLFAAIAPPVALLLVGVMLLEPPALTPRDRVPTLRLLTGPGVARPATDSDPEPDRGPRPSTPTGLDIVLEPERTDELDLAARDDRDGDEDEEDDDDTKTAEDIGGDGDRTGDGALSSDAERDRRQW